MAKPPSQVRGRRRKLLPPGPPNPGVRPSGALRPFGRRFVLEYCKDFNASRAYRRSGGPAKRADQAGYELLRRPEIADAVAVRMEEQNRDVKVEANELLRQLLAIVRADPRRLFRADGRLKPIHELDDETAASVASVEVVQENLTSGDGVRETIHKYKLWSKVDALLMAMRHVGLLDVSDAPPPPGPVFILPPGTRVQVHRPAAFLEKKPNSD